jgi:hypothetical protein
MTIEPTDDDILDDARPSPAMPVGAEAILTADREAVARKRLEDFDFGVMAQQAASWEEDIRDALTCTVQLGTGLVNRPMMFRVVFEPSSSRVRDIGISERLPLT